MFLADDGFEVVAGAVSDASGAEAIVGRPVVFGYVAGVVVGEGGPAAEGEFVVAGEEGEGVWLAVGPVVHCGG